LLNGGFLFPSVFSGGGVFCSLCLGFCTIKITNYF
jgi:hypothetical protein